MKLLSFPALAAGLLLCGGMGLTAQASSLGTSSAAGGSSASAGSSASSDAASSSSGGKQAAAAGPYRIVAVAVLPALAGQVAQVQLQLQALAADAPAPAHVLVLPQAIAARHQLAAGQTVTARPQAYGTEFVHGASREAFYLVLTGDFQRELDARPVRL